MTRSLSLLICYGLVGLFGFVQSQTFDPNKATPETWDPAKVGTDKTTNATYRNPVMTQNIGDPWMTRYTENGENWYLFTYTTNDNITLKRSRALTDNWDHAESRVIFKPDPKSGEPWSTSIWAPEIHNISNRWYVMFTATPDGDNPPPMQDALCPYNCPAVNHRMFVLESSGSDPWTSDFTLKPEVNTYDQFAIDGTYWHHNDQMYHIYSCWENAYSAWPANLCITHMSNPWTVDSSLADRRIISVPDQPWEKTPYGSTNTRLASNEGPQQLTNPKTGQQFLMYSAARVNTPFYCLGMLELVGNDPMMHTSWKKHTDGCVFHLNSAENIYGTGHASFVTSPDGSENYLVYHAQTTPKPKADLYRTARIQKFTWDEKTGAPVFPAASNGPFPVPSGQNGKKPAAVRSIRGLGEIRGI